jgi:hypothetical protein
MDQQAFTLLMNKLEEHDKKFFLIQEDLNAVLAWKFKLSGATLILSGAITIIMQIYFNK